MLHCKLQQAGKKRMRVSAMRIVIVTLSLATVLLMSGCGQNGVGGGINTGSNTSGGTISNAVIAWNSMALASVRVLQPCRPGFTNPLTCIRPFPTVIARILSITQTCEFDAWAAYDANAKATILGSSLRRPASERTQGNKTKAISFAAYRCLSDLFPDQVFKFRAEMLTLGFDPDDFSHDGSTPSGIGNLAAESVLSFRHHDGSNQLGDLHPGPYTDYTGYKPVNDPDHINNPDHWQQLLVPDGLGGFLEPQVVQFMTPFWQQVVPFALTSASQFRPSGPPSFFTDLPGYTAEVDEILDLSANLTDEQKAFAEYWNDAPETPAGHWNLLAVFVSSRDKHSLDDDVKMFFALNNALFDASIACWDVKRTYDYARPITAVHFLYGGKQVRAWAGPGLGTRMIDGAEWQPYQRTFVKTNPFPEYVSGHSTFSAAAAQALLRFTGSDSFGDSVKIVAGSSNIEPGITPSHDVLITWATFTEAADQSGLSRRLGGIHFHPGDFNGRALGRKVGDQAYDKSLTFINGN
jgi:hypothetical protein